MDRLKKLMEEAGWPRIIITLFLLSLYIACPFVDISLKSSIRDTIVRFGMNAVLVLSLVPMIYGGTGLNFGMPLGVEAGLLGAVISIELGFTGMLGFVAAIIISIPFSILFGFIYAQILNKVKGGEMMIATYVGFSSVALMCIMWLLLPFKSENMIWGYGGTGLRTTISIDGYWDKILNTFFYLGKGTLPFGEIALFALIAMALSIYFKTKNGLAIKAVGLNPEFSKATGINIDKMRTKSVVLSTVIAGVGIIIYQQSFGFIQLYNAPFYMAFPAVAAILIGGGSVNKVSIANVIIGTFLFQGILTMTPSVVSAIIKTDMSETIRIIISNGMILYALTRKVGASNGK